VLRESWKLRRAKASLLACARPACGKVVYRECTKMLSQLETDIPSVVLAAKDDRGEPLVDVQVSMDGEVLTSHLDGRALSIDPGIHHFSFTAPNGVADLVKVPISQGERNRTLSVELRQARPAAAPAVQAVAVELARARSKSPLVSRDTVPPANPRALADAIVTLLADRPARQRLASSARQWAVAHDADWTAAEFTRLYGDLV
jgi:hypothetical protein